MDSMDLICNDILYNIFTFLIADLPKLRLVDKNWSSIIDNSKELQQKFASLVLNNEKRLLIISKNLPIFPKIDLMIDGLPINHNLINKLLKAGKIDHLKHFFELKSFAKVKATTLLNSSSFKKTRLFNSLFFKIDTKTFRDFLPLIKELFIVDDLNELFTDHLSDGFFMSPEMPTVNFKDVVTRFFNMSLDGASFVDLDEFLLKLFFKDKYFFKELIETKPSILNDNVLLQYLLENHQCDESGSFLGEFDEEIIELIIQQSMEHHCYQFYPSIEKWYLNKTSFENNQDLFQQSLGYAETFDDLFVQLFAKKQSPESISSATFFSKKHVKNFSVFLNASNFFTKDVFNTILLIWGDLNIIDKYLMSGHPFKRLPYNMCENEYVINESTMTHVYDHHRYLIKQIKHMNKFIQLFSDPNHVWFNKRGRIVQILCMVSYRGKYDSFKDNEFEFAKFFYSVIGDHYDKNLLGGYSLAYFRVHFSYFRKYFSEEKDFSDLWYHLKYYFRNFEENSVFILNGLIEIGIPLDLNLNFWGDLTEVALHWFLDKGLLINTRSKLSCFLLEIIYHDAFYFWPIFEENFLKFKQTSDKKLTIYPSIFLDCMNFDIFKKLCAIGAIEKPTSTIYKLDLNFSDCDFDEIDQIAPGGDSLNSSTNSSDSSDSDDSGSSVDNDIFRVYLTEEQLVEIQSLNLERS